MYLKKKLIQLGLCANYGVIGRLLTKAQFDLRGQFRLSTEFRDDHGHFRSTALRISPNVKIVPNANSNSSRAYIMINISPDFF